MIWLAALAICPLPLAHVGNLFAECFQDRANPVHSFFCPTYHDRQRPIPRPNVSPADRGIQTGYALIAQNPAN